MAKIPYSENSVRRKIRTAKFPLSEKLRTAKIPKAKNPTANNPTAKIPSAVFTMFFVLQGHEKEFKQAGILNQLELVLTELLANTAKTLVSIYFV